MNKDTFNGLMPKSPDLKLSDDKLQAMIDKAVSHKQEKVEVEQYGFFRKLSYSAMAVSCAAILYVCSFSPLTGESQQQMVEESFEDIYEYETLEFLEEMV